MTREMKRPTSHISQTSIKPALSKVVEFYTDNNRQAYECIRERDDYIDYLERKLNNAKPQQDLPVVPERVAVQIERVKNSNGNFATLGLFDSNYDKKPDYAKWIEDNINEFMVACSVGYTVEKPQLFYLKNKITGNVLVYDESPELSEVSELFATGGEFELENYTFTQQEIESMETGSYEQIEVK